MDTKRFSQYLSELWGADNVDDLFTVCLYDPVFQVSQRTYFILQDTGHDQVIDKRCLGMAM
jgi:hypothetical protein